MNAKEHFKQLNREMRMDWQYRAEIVAGFGDEATSQLREVLCREIGRRRMTDAKRHVLQSCEFFYRAVQILKEEFEAVFAARARMFRSDCRTQGTTIIAHTLISR